MKRPQPQPPHTGGTFHRRLQPLYTEKHMVSCSGFLLNTSPMQHSCSHHNAFCSMTWLTRMYLRTWQHQMTTIMQPFRCDLQIQTQETQRITHVWTTTRCRTQRRNWLRSERPQPQPPRTGGTLHRRLQRLYTEKHKVLCSGFLTPPFINVLLCDVKSHAALHQCIVMWCSVSQFCLSVTRKIASQLPLVISLWPLSLTWAPGRLSGVSP